LEHAPDLVLADTPSFSTIRTVSAPTGSQPTSSDAPQSGHGPRRAAAIVPSHSCFRELTENQERFALGSTRRFTMRPRYAFVEQAAGDSDPALDASNSPAPAAP